MHCGISSDVKVMVTEEQIVKLLIKAAVRSLSVKPRTWPDAQICSS